MKALKTWIENNYDVTLSAVPLVAQGKMLYLAKKRPEAFDRIMIKGFTLYLHYNAPGIEITDKLISVYVSEARLKLATILQYQCSDYPLPLVPLFSLSAINPLEKTLLHNFELLVFQQPAPKPVLHLIKGGL